MPKQYIERLTLDADIDLQGFGRTQEFVRRKMKVACELVDIHVGDGTIREDLLDKALAAVEDGDEIRKISLALFTRRRDELAVALVWDPAGSSFAEVVGTEETQVLGVAQALRKYVARRRFMVDLPGGPGRRTWLPSWLRDISVQVMGLVIGTGALMAIATLWALVR